ncbi:hypothetical protein [Pseudomonas fontis]|uniref:Uncharacterized protein n=1 Tax=Pseudomonas fontis TaxID=2942633 RepID=A0ABT5NTA2_9PSED|nr:hypothetical protein [Pseudomonas fontis]MDD0977049.1 hypothetical protein [Pseudomonas fontis]MDD0991400.1 hypothetical protein [Pseudomonas fontis]
MAGNICLGAGAGQIAGNAGSHRDRIARLNLWELALPAIKCAALAGQALSIRVPVRTISPAMPAPTGIALHR